MNLLKSLISISFITIFSRIAGYIRDHIIARFFGASIATDAFLVAFRLPNILRRIFAEGAFSQAFIPILSTYKNHQGEKATRIFISYITGMLILILSIITLIGIIIAPWIIYITAPSFIEIKGKFELTVKLLRIIFPYILLISLSSLIGSILNIWNNFIIPTFTPTLLNISMIVSILFFSPYYHPPIMVLSWSVLIGGVLQILYQLPYLYKIGMLVIPRISFHYIGVYQLIKSIGPSIIGISIGQISLLINMVFSSFLKSGSISWTYYADRLMELPIGVLGVTLSTILLPSLTKSVLSGNKDEYQYLMNWGLRLCLLLALPSTVALIILAKPLIISLFQYGNFTNYDVKMTQFTLITYCIGLMGFILIKVLAPGFYSIRNIKIPVQIAIMTLILTQLMNLIFIKLLQHIGLALSISLGACFNAFMLYFKLRQKNVFIPLAGWKKFLFKLILASLIMMLVLLFLVHMIPILVSNSMFVRITRLLFIITIGIIIYFITLFICGFRLYHFLFFIDKKNNK